MVMIEPEIPQNTGNIARTCAITGAKLHLVHPLGFKIDEKSLKRAGLDYWDKIEMEEHNSLEEFLRKYPPERNHMFFATTKGKTKYTDVDYSKMDEVFVLYGKETKGLPEWLLEKYLNTKPYEYWNKFFEDQNNKNTNASYIKIIKFIQFCCYYYL